MARLVNNSVNPLICARIVTKFADGTSTEKLLKVGDMVENLRYVVNDEIKTVSGRISNITTTIKNVTAVNLKNVNDYFAKDVQLKSIIVDCSEQYYSKVVTVPAKEIIEDEGVTDVTKVDHIAYPIITMDMEYSDGSIVNQDLEIGDVIGDVVIMNDSPGKPDITGTFKICALYYLANKSLPAIKGLYLVPVDGGTGVKAVFDKIISFEEKTHADVTNSSSLIEITNALNESEDGVVFAKLGVDVTVPKRDDGKITTTMVGTGKTLNLDLAGHEISTQAYAFYVNGGTLNITDTTGNGKIEGTCNTSKAAYPVVFVAAGGTCNMDSGHIDSTNVDTSEPGTANYLYGVVCSGDGIFNMTGGKITTGGASCISITNGTASGEGAKFIISGDSKLYTEDNAAIYLADNKSVIIKDNAKISGGIVARMGDIIIEDNANVVGGPEGKEYYLGEQVTTSGVVAPSAAILALTGVYNSSLGNDMNISIAKTARVKGANDDAIDVAFINTKYDQTVKVDVDSKNSISYKRYPWKVYTHDELAEIAAAEGRTLAAETNTTDLTITVDGTIVYPVVDGE